MLTPADVKNITALDNLILKNLKITQAYAELSLGMQRVIGDRNANWCSFATHASKTAGYAIRNEVMPSAINQALTHFDSYRRSVAFLGRYLEDPTATLYGNGGGLVQEILLRVSRSVSLGNCKVFAELAPLFSRLITWFAHDDRPDPDKLQLFLSQLRMGSVEDGEGQVYLIEAFTAYYQARFETEPKKKAELVFLANLLVGMHEQIRLQPNIAGALHAPAEELLQPWLQSLTAGLPYAAGPALRQVVMIRGRQFFATIATNTMMVITVPAGNLALNQDVRSPAGYSKFPQELATIEHSRLRELAQRWDRHLDTLRGSAATDWASLADRMSFIIDFFRSHQQNPNLFTPPFSAAQAGHIHAGCIPAGQL
jgi:hypothetical protein